MRVINDDELKLWLENHERWSFDKPEIVLEYNFDNFIKAFGFLSQVAVIMEKHDHHPTIKNSYGAVRLSMATHDAGNKITDRDLKLAEAIEELL